MAIELNANLVFSLIELDAGGFDSRFPEGGSPGGGGGELANGQNLTITGSGFGSVADPRPSTYDDFNGYSLNAGALIPDGAGTNWGENGGTWASGFVLDNAVKLPGRQFSAKSEAPKSVFQDPIVTGQPLSSVTHYSSHWRRFNESLRSPTQPTDNRADKMIRMTDGDSDCGTRVSWEARVWRCYITHPTDYGLCRSGSGSDYVWDKYLTGDPWSTAGVWRRVETVWFANGDVSLRIDGQEVHRFIGVFHPPGFTDSEWRQTIIGYDASQTSNLTTTLRSWLADAVTQGGLDRIEFSNNPTYDPTQKQKRYYQYCSSWADGQLVIPSAQFGDLDLSSPVYMHIIKPDDTAINVQLQVGTNVTVA